MLRPSILDAWRVLMWPSGGRGCGCGGRWHVHVRGLDFEQIDRAARGGDGGELAVGNQLVHIIGGSPQ